ncbi:MAG: biotin/lipoyl-containing protein, partial [SAR324 cluster bacterium]|nr:biotin/lipoyl-containing protein [SAR324 cluster bacterium]
MIKTKDILIPDIGEFDQVEVIEVLVKSGDIVSAEDPLLTMESDKASMDVPSPFGGIVKTVKIKAGDKVSQNDLILTLSVEGGENSSLKKTSNESSTPKTLEDANSFQKTSIEVPSSPRNLEVNKDSGIRSKSEKLGIDNAHSFNAHRPSPTQMFVDQKKFSRAHASPSIRKFARELGVDLSQVHGTGRKGRITKQDVQVFVKDVMSSFYTVGAPKGGTGIPEIPEIDFSKYGSVEIQSLSRIKKKTAVNLHRSWLNLPIVT